MTQHRHPAYGMKAHRDTYAPNRPSTLVPRNVSAQLDGASADAMLYLQSQLPHLAIADLVRLGLVTLGREMRWAERKRNAATPV